ncbi:MAG: prepilin peptidase [Acetobacteraceae bacterium]
MGWLGGFLAALVVALLVLAALADIATRTIPDTIAAAVAVLGMAARLRAGPSALALSVAAALVLFVLLVVLHARGLMGGGDVKLAAATCLGLSLQAVHPFVVVTAMAGGVLALLHLAGRWALRDVRRPLPAPRGASLPRRIFSAERWRIARHGSLPYGVAIACGGIWAVLNGQGS